MQKEVDDRIKSIMDQTQQVIEYEKNKKPEKKKKKRKVIKKKLDEKEGKEIFYIFSSFEKECSKTKRNEIFIAKEEDS